MHCSSQRSARRSGRPALPGGAAGQPGPALEPGYTFGAVLVVADLALPPGDYRLHLTYSNGAFRDVPERPVGALVYETSRPFAIR